MGTNKMPGACWSTVIVICIASLIVLASARGVDNDADPLTVYIVDPKEPVLFTEKHKQPQVLYSVDGAYTNWDLGYYSLFYPQLYKTFVGTDRHLALIQTITTSGDDDLKVCVNHDVHLGNLTLGAFTCPLPFEPDQFDLCCGLQDAEFCCTSKSAGRSLGIAAFVGVSAAIILFGALFYTFAGRQLIKTSDD